MRYSTRHCHRSSSDCSRWTFHFVRYFLVWITLLSATDSASAQGTPDGQPKKKLQVKIPMKTLGGRQFWGDVTFFHGWKIQQNVLTKHHRLLDEKDFNHASGTLEKCEEKLNQIREGKKLPEMSGHAVIMIHGIVRSSKSMSRMQKSLAESGFVPVPFDYPSTQANLDRCSEFLDSVIKSLDGVKEISFVTHSMGGLVVRNWLKEHEDKRVRRLVMLGTPNKGAEMADKLRDWKIYKLILGPAGQQLISGDGSDASKLPVPKFEFAVIAGARGTAEGYNPLIPGDDDGTVAVKSAFLEGAADSEMFPVLHSFLPVNPDVVKSTVRFLKTGSLRESGERKPVEAAADAGVR
jgi:pimeloyl-ACP methyl ester carboxylesterase